MDGRTDSAIVFATSSCSLVFPRRDVAFILSSFQHGTSTLFYYLHLFIHPIVISSPRYAFPWPFSLSLDLHRCILVPVFTVVAVTCCVCTCATDI